jgi:hypothetical protein
VLEQGRYDGAHGLFIFDDQDSFLRHGWSLSANSGEVECEWLRSVYRRIFGFD